MPLPATTKWLGVTTIGGHVSRALAFVDQTDVWVALGKPTEWSVVGDAAISDNNPPDPDPTATDLDEPEFASKATLQLVVPDDAGSLEVYGQTWRPVDAVEAKAIGCRWVLVSAPFSYNKCPIGAYDSYLLADTAAGETVLGLYNSAGYLVGDSIQVGYQGLQTTVSAVDPGANTITLADALTDDVIAGSYVTVLAPSAPYQFRQSGVLTNVVTTGAPGQLVKPIAFLSSYQLEYYNNFSPVPRALGRADRAQLILTF